MTSNLGAEYLLKGLSAKTTMENAREMVMQEVRRHFKPELLNRLDEIVVFDPLSHDQLKKVPRLQMKDVAIRLADRGVALEVTETALDVILDESYDPVYGARPIRRWLERKVVTELSRMLIREEIDENATVYIDADTNREVVAISSGDVNWMLLAFRGFSGLQGISGSQKFQIHKVYGSFDCLPSAHSW